MNTPLTKREQAHEILRALLADRNRIEIEEAVEAGRANDVSRRTMERAARDLGLVNIHNGPMPGFWQKND